MATFLTTRRMAPELAARIEASVRGTRGSARGAGRAKWSPRTVAVARLALVLAVAAVTWSVTILRRDDRRELEKERGALLATVRAQSASLTREDDESVARAESWLERSSGAYAGDVVADELRAKGALAALLARPSVYVRGTLAQMETSAGIAQAAAASMKDPFLVCLVNPPAARTESALLARVHDAYADDAESHSAQVRRLREEQIGLPFLLPAWSEKVRDAKTSDDLDLLRRELAKAPIDAARRAAQARLLIFAIDEPGEASGVTELDGERAHPVRIGIVDLASSRMLLSRRVRVDPSWISAAKRSLYSGGLDACALAYDVREGLGR